MFNPPNELSGLVDWNDLYSHPPFVEEWLAYPVVPKGRLISLYGPAKVGKSLFVLELAASVATGRDFLGQPTTKSRVLYIDRENDPYRDVLERLKQMGFTAEELDGSDATADASDRARFSLRYALLARTLGSG